METHHSDQRPRITLIERAGDPLAAVALAVSVNAGAGVAHALGRLGEARLRADGFGATRMHENELGYGIEIVLEPSRVAAFVTAATRALLTPVSPGDAAALADVKTRETPVGAELALARCTGEARRLVDDAGAPVDTAALERWRAQQSSSSVAFAAIGPRDALLTGSSALESGPAWPDATTQPTWPSGDVTGTSRLTGPTARLEVALRTPERARALAARSRLAEDDAPIGWRSRLVAGWRHVRTDATVHPSGACLYAEFEHASADPTPESVSRIAYVARDELSRALGEAADDPWELEAAMLSAADPRDAAAIAAWHTLEGARAPGRARWATLYSGAATTGPELEPKPPPPSSLEVARLEEPGQGELWALLASPCGTARDTLDDAAATALMLRAISTASSSDRVVLEPWLTPHGVGIIVHGPAASADEPPARHARRLATRLGRALLGSEISGARVSGARERTQIEYGSSPYPNWWLALETTAPHRAGLLEPRGSFDAVTTATPFEADEQRIHFTRGPLRLAVLANAGGAQVDALHAELHRYLGLVRDAPAECAKAPPPKPEPGLYRVTTTSSAHAAAVLSVPFPVETPQLPREAEWTALLLNRPGGVLERALSEGLDGARATAQVRGARPLGALLIEVSAAEGQLDRAVARVRGALEQLRLGAATATETNLVEAAFAHIDRERSLDPRRRLIEAWSRARPTPAPTLASLRAFHARALLPEGQIVVIAEPK